ncbi:MAG TPA: carboxymuconolactone decarboxylase family protein [Pseudonocardiaceae bacterium]|nr:carboxymuconolactone decarboxylase family protein [Pseudonocardiaceae bacterium]
MTAEQPSQSDIRRQQGLEIRDRILGPAWNEQSRTSPGLEMFTEAGIENIWCGSWIDPTLELRLKSTATIVAMIAMRHSGLLGFHVAGALRENLLTADEIRALALHLNPYVGYPTARDAMVVIDRVIAEHEQHQEQR